MENDKPSYIVAYNSTHAEVHLLMDDRNNRDRKMLDEFLYACGRLGLNRDDIVGWNNQYWSIVDANDPCDALNKFKDKLIEYLSGNRIHPVEGE